MGKIRIAHVITRMDWGGSPDIVRILCENPFEGYDVTLITGESGHITAGTERFLKNFRSKTIVIRSFRRDIDPFHDIVCFMELYKVFKKEKFDIVHTHTAKAGALGRLAAWAAGNRAIVHTPHGNNFYGYFGRFMSGFIVLIERALERCTKVFAVLSELEKEDLVRFRITTENKIAVVPSGLEKEYQPADKREILSRRESIGIKEGMRLVGLVSRLEPVKGPGYFIDAVPLILKNIEDVVFMVVGDGSMRPCLEERVKKYGLEKSVKFTGWRDDASELISCLDVLVQPSCNEGVGRVLLEAQAMGVPVVASRVGGIPEMVKPGVTGILVEPGDSAGLAKAVSSLLTDDVKRQQMAGEAAEWANANFTRDGMLTRMRSVYSKMLDKI